MSSITTISMPCFLRCFSKLNSMTSRVYYFCLRQLELWHFGYLKVINKQRRNCRIIYWIIFNWQLRETAIYLTFVSRFSLFFYSSKTSKLANTKISTNQSWVWTTGPSKTCQSWVPTFSTFRHTWIAQLETWFQTRRNSKSFCPAWSNYNTTTFFSDF